MEKKAMIPKLRFPEFEGDWDRKKIKNCLSIGSGKDYKHLNKGEIPVYGTGGLMTYVDDFLYDGETVCIGRKGTIDNPRYFNGKIWTVDTLFYTNSFKETLPKFIYFIFQRINWKQHNEASGVPSLSKNTIESIKITLPTLPEQQKIASFFTAIDQKLTHLKRKKTLLEHYKKGVMQKIFKQEIRFKPDEGGNYPNWERKRLGEFLIPTFREVEKPKSNYLAIGIRSHCKGTFQKPNSEPDKIAMDKLYEVKAGDLIVNITFAWESAIAIVKPEDEGGLVSHRFPTYVFNRNVVLGEFFKYVFIQKGFRQLLDLISPGGAGRNRVLSKADFLKLKWVFPSIEEQTKIANFLSAIDKKIEGVAEAIEVTEKWKKGLMQQMFC